MNGTVSADRQGLSSDEAAARLLRDGPNVLPSASRRTFRRILLDVVREPMFALLLAGGGVYLLLGDLNEALLLLAFASLSVGITVVQESRSERVLEALRDLSSPRAVVIRDGQRVRIAGRDVVPGDLLMVAEGDRVPADAVLIDAKDLQADESLLTGESVPVRKTVGMLDGTGVRPGGDDLPVLFSGTLIVRGQGVAEVRATGTRTELGRIGRSLAGISTEPTRLSVQTRRLVKVLALAGGGVSLAAVLLFGLVRGDWLQGLLGGIALGMSMLPEEFPLVLAVFMVMGAWRISRARVLTRRAAAIESLGAATVLCTDKTGTLTENRMRVAALRVGDMMVCMDSSAAPPSAPIRDLLACGLLASAEHPFDPMEVALHAAALGQAELPAGRRLVGGYGLRPELLAMSQVWETGEGTGRLVCAKGAPEAIARLCRLDAESLGALERAVGDMARAGMRVLAAAKADCGPGPLPSGQTDFPFRLVGLIGFTDPLRMGVRDAVDECRNAGIRILMITGDYPATARAIADEAGIAGGAVLTGEALEALDAAALRRVVAETSVFARVMPEQKLRIVEALKANGEIVAMTGDGVNDAPSLKAAHIGVAMGGRGTDVAREASAIVLLDDDFSSLVRTVRLGRRIFDNLRKAFGYILAVHVPIAGLALMPLLLGWPIILGPVHIAFLEMVIDPVCSVVFEAERAERDVMRRPPRDPSRPLFSRSLVAWGMVQGFLALLVVGGVFVGGRLSGMPDDELRALVFVSLVMTNIALILVNRSYSASIVTAVTEAGPVLAAVVAVTGAIILAAVTWPPAERLFGFGPLHAGDLAVTLGGAVALVIVLEFLKPRWRQSLQG